MTTLELDQKILTYKALQRQIRDLQVEADAYKEQIMAEMGRLSLTNLKSSNYKVSYKQVTQRRIDTKLLSATYPEVAQACTRTLIFRRFEVR